MVNHYLLTDEQLVDRFLELIEENTYIKWIGDEPDIRYDAKRSSEYWDIRREILERIKNNN